MGRIKLILLAVALQGCTMSPSADLVKALAGDPNSLCWIITSPWGGSTLDRNHGCSGNTGTTPIIMVSPSGGIPSQVQVIKP